MSAWDEVTVGGSMSLLPEGVRTFEITKARAEVSDKGQKLRELTLGLASPSGVGEVTVPLEPFIHTPDGVEMWERIFKGAALGLGFKPSAGHLPMTDIAAEFAGWIPGSGLVGKMVEVNVKHVESKKLKDDGTPFINHRVEFRGIVGNSGSADHPAPLAAAGAVPDFASAASTDPWA